MHHCCRCQSCCFLAQRHSLKELDLLSINDTQPDPEPETAALKQSTSDEDGSPIDVIDDGNAQHRPYHLHSPDTILPALTTL